MKNRDCNFNEHWYLAMCESVGIINSHYTCVQADTRYDTTEYDMRIIKELLFCIVNIIRNLQLRNRLTLKVHMNVVPRSTGNTYSGTRELTLKCKL